MAEKGKKPDYRIRAKIDDFWHDCGAAWILDGGKISVKLTMLPAGKWDGNLLMLPPKDE